MSFINDLTSEVSKIFKTTWQKRDGQVVPEAEDVKLDNDAVQLDGTVLYADLAESTNLVMLKTNEFAAEVYKSYLVCASRIIKENGGFITAFDGDRVMGVFIGNRKNSSAAIAALQINYAVTYIINPQIKEVYKTSTFVLSQSVGIDTSKLFIAKTGVRGANDLVWVGRSANYAAKLCSLREGSFTSFITSDVFAALAEDAKFGGDPKQVMWEQSYWADQKLMIYRSSWWKKP
ncbi:MAG: adenylate/guanylate cyclase domain-containing protein [Verrucomicrobiota bacterium]